MLGNIVEEPIIFIIDIQIAIADGSREDFPPLVSKIRIDVPNEIGTGSKASDK